MEQRTATITRKTNETDIKVALNLDGSGQGVVETGIPFFDHMLMLFAKHGIFDLSVECKGDLSIDAHHSVEDIGICLGLALDRALGDKSGIVRFAHSYFPMDDTLARVALDISGRPYLVYRKAFVTHARLNVHIELLYGHNTHHIFESVFKAAARALSIATRKEPRAPGIPSTKGVL
jgi:imidazoleglycerol-phosphate dehydratase